MCPPGKKKVCKKNKTNSGTNITNGKNINKREGETSKLDQQAVEQQARQKSVRKLPLGPVMVARIKLMLAMSGNTNTEQD